MEHDTDGQALPPQWRQMRVRKSVWGLLLTACVFIGWFYWYQYRPMDVRSTCALETSKRAFGPDETATSTKGLDLIRVQNELFETYYLLCVRSHGLPN